MLLIAAWGGPACAHRRACVPIEGRAAHERATPFAFYVARDGIRTVPADGAPSQLVDARREGSYSNLAVAPGGRTVAFESSDSRGREIDVASVVGPAVRVAGLSEGGLAQDVLWSRDGRRLAALFLFGDDAHVRMADLAPSPSTALVTRGVARGLDARTRGLAWSPDGRRVARVAVASSRTEDHGCVVLTFWEGVVETIDLASGDVRRVAGPFPNVWNLTWSPDGRLLTFTSWATLHAVLADGTGAAWTHATRSGAFTTQWDSAGVKLLVHGGDPYDPPAAPSATTTLTVVDPDGRVLHDLAVKPPLAHVAWSPDGRAVLGTRGERLLSIDLATGVERVLATDAAYPYEVASGP